MKSTHRCSSFAGSQGRPNTWGLDMIWRMLESLESRRLFAGPSIVVTPFPGGGPSLPVANLPAIPFGAIPAIKNGVLTLYGTSGDDRYTIARSDQIDVDSTKPRYVISSDGTITTLPVETLAPGTAPTVGTLPAGLPGGPYLRIQVSDQAYYFVQAAGVTRIHANAAAGNDRVIIAKNIELPVVVLGGRGNDTLEGGANSDTLFGGVGNDLLFGGHGTAADRLDGGEETNVYNWMPGDTIVDSVGGTLVPVPSQSLAPTTLYVVTFRSDGTPAFRFIASRTSISNTSIQRELPLLTALR
jgi:hypothetical protein